MTASETPTFGEWIERRGRDAAARAAAHPDAGALTTVGYGDVAATWLRGSLDLLWQPDGALHGRRADSVSVGWYVVADADGVANVDLLRRWATERAILPEAAELTAEDWAAVADGVVAIARRERAQVARTGPTASVAEAVARRLLSAAWVVRIADDGRLVGHERRLEPTRADVAEHEARMASLSPVNRLFGGGPAAPDWPDDREITPAVVADFCRSANVVQTGESVPEWTDVVAAMRAEAEAMAVRHSAH